MKQASAATLGVQLATHLLGSSSVFRGRLRGSEAGTTTSVIAVASQSGIIARRSRHGSFNTQRLLEFLETLHLAAGTVFLLDNVSFHHAKEVKALACQRGWTLLYTPPYSPWFNPIEGMFSIVKRAFYKNGSIDHAFSRLTQSHACAFFGQSLRLRKQPT